MIHVQSLTRKYGDKVAVNELTFDAVPARSPS